MFLAPVSTALTGTLAHSYSQKENTFNHAGCLIPHKEKLDKGGEDAFYSNSHVLAVADGVGGWNRHGIDPAIYSRKLCSNIEDFCSKNSVEEWEKNPHKLIQESWKNNQEIGSSTLVVVTLPRKGSKIYASNVGDSGFVILRNSLQEDKKTQKLEVVHASEAQQFEFNFPYQLGWGRNGDHPEVAFNSEHEVKDGDWVVVGSDGLFDNMGPPLIASFLSEYLSSGKGHYSSLEVATKIRDEAHKLSMDSSWDSPFAQGAREAGRRFSGGKEDDITVVVGKVNLQE